MLDCLIWLVIYAIIAVLVVYIVEVAFGAFFPLPPPIFLLIRLLVGLLILLWFLGCLGLWSGFGGLHVPLRH